MKLLRFVAAVVVCLLAARSAAGQPPPEPPPAWDVAVGAAFVGTSGNTDTSTVGADFAMNRRWPVWKIEAAALTISTTDGGEQTAERYLAALRANRQLTSIIGLTFGERLERDQFAGIDFRSILDGGLTYALVRQPRWTFDAVTSVAWSHENPVMGGDSTDHPVGVLQAPAHGHLQVGHKLLLLLLIGGGKIFGDVELADRFAQPAADR